MDNAMGIVMGLVLTVVALAMLVGQTFLPFKANQAMLASTNASLMSSLQAEMDEGVAGGSEVTGSTIKSLINSSVSNNNIEIYVNGTKWDGKNYDTCNLTINITDKYKRVIEVNGSKTKYTFTN